jgi:hypothetical protein
MAQSTISANQGSNGADASSNGSAAAQGNMQLQQAFDTALAQAQNTLIISTYGEANLNALRARPQ